MTITTIPELLSFEKSEKIRKDRLPKSKRTTLQKKEMPFVDNVDNPVGPDIIWQIYIRDITSSSIEYSEKYFESLYKVKYLDFHISYNDTLKSQLVNLNVHSKFRFKGSLGFVGEEKLLNEAWDHEDAKNCYSRDVHIYLLEILPTINTDKEDKMVAKSIFIKRNIKSFGSVGVAIGFVIGITKGITISNDWATVFMPIIIGGAIGVLIGYLSGQVTKIFENY